MKKIIKEGLQNKNNLLVLISLLFLILFVFIGKLFFNSLYKIDLIINTFFENFQGSETLIFLIKILSAFSDWKFILFLSILLIYFLSKKSKFDSKIFAFTMFFSGILILFLKNLFERQRPESIIEIAGFSFPSGHTILGSVFYGFVVYFSWKYTKKPIKQTLMFLGSIMIFLSGFLRIFLGVHWFSDIIAGFIISFIILFIAIDIIEKPFKKIKIDNFNQN